MLAWVASKTSGFLKQHRSEGKWTVQRSSSPSAARSSLLSSKPPVADDSDEGAPFYRKALLTAVLGNVVEWYDNALYGILAVFLARTFYPDSDPTAALLATYVGLIAAYAVRPAGGVLMGRISDVRGHRFTLMLTVGLMTGGPLLICLLPGYSAVGLAAPALLLLCRLVQGASASGEYTVAANFILQHNTRRKRQYLAGWSVGSDFGRAAARPLGSNNDRAQRGASSYCHIAAKTIVST